MYDADTLLDELHDEDSPRVVRSLDLDDEEDGDLGLDDELDDTLIVGDVDELDTSDDALLSADETESWSDDPVRMYLTQMGEIPLLTRQQEISLAKQIEITRAKFRRKLLECDYVMQQAVRVLRRVHDGELPFDRTVQVSVTDRLEKDQILGRLPITCEHWNLAEAKPPRLSCCHGQIAAAQRAAGSLAAVGTLPETRPCS